jgi:hypothetical protein
MEDSWLAPHVIAAVSKLVYARTGLHDHVSKITFGVLRADSSGNPLVLHVFLKK